MRHLIYLSLTIAVMMLCGSACNKMEDDLFEKDPATRMDEKMADFRRVMNNNTYGWAIYTCNATYQRHASGQAFAVRFDSIWSTFYSSSSTAYLPDYWGQTNDSIRSMYSLKMDNGVVLSFDTYNGYFHYYADQSDYFSDDLQSDFEFVLNRYSQNEDTIFGYSKIKHLPFMMIKMYMPAPDYQSTCDGMSNYQPYNCMIQFGDSVFQARFLGGYKNFEFWHDEYLTKGGDGDLHTYANLTTGIYMIENINYLGYTVTEFRLNETKDLYVSVESPDVKIKPNPLVDYMLINGNEYYYFGIANTSDTWHQLLLKTGEVLDKDGRCPTTIFKRAQFAFEEDRLSLYFNRWELESNQVRYPLQYERVSDNKIRIMWDGTENSSRDYTFYEAGLYVFLDKLFPKGQWVTYCCETAGGTAWNPSSIHFYKEDEPDYYINTNGDYRYEFRNPYAYGYIFSDDH